MAPECIKTMQFKLLTFAMFRVEKLVVQQGRVEKGLALLMLVRRLEDAVAGLDVGR